MPEPATDVFTALAPRGRREVLDALVGGERAVGELALALGQPQPQVSKHLRALRDAGLVRCRAQGRRRLYRLEATRLRALRDWLARYEDAMNARLDRVDDYLQELRGEAEPT